MSSENFDKQSEELAKYKKETVNTLKYIAIPFTLFGVLALGGLFYTGKDITFIKIFFGFIILITGLIGLSTSLFNLKKMRTRDPIEEERIELDLHYVDKKELISIIKYVMIPSVIIGPMLMFAFSEKNYCVPDRFFISKICTNEFLRFWFGMLSRINVAIVVLGCFMLVKCLRYLRKFKDENFLKHLEERKRKYSAIRKNKIVLTITWTGIVLVLAVSMLTYDLYFVQNNCVLGLSIFPLVCGGIARILFYLICYLLFLLFFVGIFLFVSSLTTDAPEDHLFKR